MADEYERLLMGTVGLGYLDCTLLEYARGIKYFIEEESRKPNCDTHLINLLRRAACVGWENIHLFKQSPIVTRAPSDTEQRLREALRTSAYQRHKVDGTHAPNFVSFDDCKREDCVIARAALQPKAEQERDESQS